MNDDQVDRDPELDPKTSPAGQKKPKKVGTKTVFFLCELNDTKPTNELSIMYDI